MSKENFYCKMYLNNKVKKVETYIDDENKQYVLLDDFEFLLQYSSKRIEEYHQKINKAIECIDNREWVDCEECVNQVYNILRGEE